MDITKEDIIAAIEKATSRRKKRADVVRLMRHRSAFVDALFSTIKSGRWNKHIQYRQLVKVNNNGKVRHINSPNLTTLVLQHLALLKIYPLYKKYDQSFGLNCKPGCGITANNRRRSVVKRVKHLYYDRRDLHYAVCIDQRECYAHITRKLLRKGLKYITSDKWLIDYAVDVTFNGKIFPVGTPTSPMMHHVIMLPFEKWLQNVCPLTIRYADDVLMPFATKEEAKQAMWRVKMYWWYEFQLRSKSYTQRVVSLLEKNDFCGYITIRNNNKTITSHNKGYVTLRDTTYRNAVNCKGNKSYSSYFGLLKHADMYNVMKHIEKSNMNLKQLTEKIKIVRKLDAQNIKIPELIEGNVRFTIYDYEMRRGTSGEFNWIKCLIGIPEIDKETKQPTGKILAKEYHTGAPCIVQFHVQCEKMFGKSNLLPMTDMLIEDAAGYIYEGSTDMMEYIDDNYKPS